MTEPLRKGPKVPLDHEPEGVWYARRQAGLTQSQLAEMCGTTQPQISEIENGTRNATPAMIKKLAAALNCPRVVLERKRHESEATPPADGSVHMRDMERPVGQDDLPDLQQRAVDREAS